jgi:hypothetical protein
MTMTEDSPFAIVRHENFMLAGIVAYERVRRRMYHVLISASAIAISVLRADLPATATGLASLISSTAECRRLVDLAFPLAYSTLLQRLLAMPTVISHPCSFSLRFLGCVGASVRHA